jgi:hypothetical protein
MKISKSELYKPVAKKKEGGFVILKEVLDGTVILEEEMEAEDYRDLAIARYEMMDSSKAIVVGKRSYTKDQIIEEIRRRTDVAETFVRMQSRLVRMLLDRKQEIEFAEQQAQGKGGGSHEN